MRRLIGTYSAGMVATVDADGSPAVSPKGTFVVVDATTLAFGDLRSPGTIANLECSPSVEVCFLDVLAREAVRVRGTARIVALDTLGDAALEARWSEYLPHMRQVVEIDVTAAELVRPPA